MSLRNALLAGAALVITLVVSEGLLRLALPARDKYYVNVPDTDLRGTIPPSIVRGVDSIVHYRLNSLGIRGRDFGADSSEYRILAVGGSTTECVLLNNTQAWPAVIERMLHRTADGRQVWVGNVGRSGLTSREHVLHLEHLLPQYPRIDAVVALVGVNDVLTALRQGDAYRLPRPITEPDAERDDLRRAFAVLPHMEDLPVDGMHFGWYRSTALFDVARRARLAWSARGSFAFSPDGGLVQARRRRRLGPLLDSVPSLDAPLVEYRRNLNGMADMAVAHHVRLVLVTQPSLWRDSMPAAEERDLWLGWRGEGWQSADGFYAPRALATAMQAFNVATADVCRARHLDCVNVSDAVPRNGTMFYDDVHLTVSGSRRVAELVSRHFAARAPFVSAQAGSQYERLNGMW